MKIEKYIELLEQERKRLHAYPEISGKEFHTQEQIIDFLKSHCNIKPVKVADTGVLVELKANKKGKSILIRGDIDALPIEEVNEFDHKSKNKGVSHTCGHDGHTTIILGLALVLSKYPITKGTVYLLFQPSEENGKGANRVLSDQYFKSLKIDYVFALHNLPGFPLHQIVIKENEFTAHVKSLIIKLRGKTAHAAEPEKGYNPAKVIAKILQYSFERTHNHPESKDFFLITPICVNMGKIAYGISAAYGEVHFTIRSWSTQLMEAECNKLEAMIKSICFTEHLDYQTTYLEEFYSNNNNKEAAGHIRNAAKKCHLNVSEINNPFKWGEDFGLFTQRYRGALFGIGAGVNKPALHNPDYDFSDEIIPTGISLFYTIIENIQSS
jgi:amidohydrolase